MNKKSAFTLLALPFLAAAYVIYQPGVAFAKTPLASKMAPGAFQQSGQFTIDPVHTFAGFDIGHLGLSRVQGRFDKLTGSLHIDAQNMTHSTVQVTMQTDSVDTNVPPRDTDLKSANFFDVTKFPEMTFMSTRIRKVGMSYRATGDLTIKGVTKPVTISFKKYGPIKDPWGANRIGVVAEPLTVHRSDFGMTFDADSISDDVVIRLSMEATEDKAK